MKFVIYWPSRGYLKTPKTQPIFGSLFIVPVLKELGFEVKIVDTADGLRFEESDWYGIYVTTPDYLECLDILKFIKQHNPNAKVVAGGPHATLMPSQCLLDGFDYVCVGDGEEAIKSLIKNPGKKVHTGFLRDLNKYHPDRRIINLHEYSFKVGKYKAAQLITARGCVWRKCVFCCILPKPWCFYRPHGVKWVEEELVDISSLGFKAVAVYDDEFFVHKKRDWEIVKLLGKYVEIWRCFARAVDILQNKELVKYASENGLIEVLIGVESLSEKILQTINKGVSTVENIEAIKYLHEIGVKPKAAMIIGLPGESWQTLKETWEKLEKIEKYVESFDFTVFIPYPGSEVFKNPDKFDLKFDPNVMYTSYKGFTVDFYRNVKGFGTPKIWTSNLTSEEIAMFRDIFDARFRLKMNIKFPENKEELKKIHHEVLEIVLKKKPEEVIRSHYVEKT